MKGLVLFGATFALMFMTIAIAPGAGRAQSNGLPQAMQDNCVNVEVRQFYPGQAGSEMYYVTNNCGKNINIDFATQGMPTQFVGLQSGEGQFTGWSGKVPAPYKYWYCPQPYFPSDPDNNPLNGPTYDAQRVVCRN